MTERETLALFIDVNRNSHRGPNDDPVFGWFLSDFEVVWPNARRHLGRAGSHLRRGRPRWAFGSLRKALRNACRAAEVDP